MLEDGNRIFIRLNIWSTLQYLQHVVDVGLDLIGGSQLSVERCDVVFRPHRLIWLISQHPSNQVECSLLSVSAGARSDRED